MGDERPFTRLKRWGLTGTFVAFGGILIWSGADLLVGRTISRFSPQIEKTLSNSLGHPVEMGGYRRLLPWGVELGPTKLLPSLKDSSSVDISNLTIKFAPLASLFNWQPVAIFNPKGTSILLNRNDTGSFWVMPQSDNSKPLNFQLRFNLKDPTKIVFNSGETILLAKGSIGFNLAKNKIYGAVNLDSKKQGSINLSGKGYWDGLEFKTKARINKIKLSILQDILGRNSNILAKGDINGVLNLEIEKGFISCKGDLMLKDLALKGGILNDTLSTKNSQVKCNDNKLNIVDSNWDYFNRSKTYY